ncbi:uncharacterized protein LOC134187573 [Corticium candelabrum]|uniref:uncharacterized protein LOC134187573 n=1 Tax=Corticium candelabrum TaxID=121492 RepID=UPI002E26A3F5|nr:uncharacterized protein LOC134187573 [Corticium candelabrum]
MPEQSTPTDMVNQLGKFLPRLAEKTEPLRALTSKSEWIPTAVSSDASAYGLGAVIRQKQDNGEWKPIAYALRRLEKLPLRVQRFRLRLMQYQFTISHVPGRNIHTPDTLPSCPVCENRANLQSQDLATASNEYVDEILDSLPVQTKKTLAKLRGQQDADETCYQLKQFCRSGWPPKHKLKGDIKKFWAVLSELPVKMAYYYVVADWLPLPRCKQRFCKSFIWDTLALLNVERAHDQHRLWQTLGTDSFEWKGKFFLLVIDYYPRYPKVVSLSSTSSKEVIDKMKAMFARHGRLEVRSDNGPQYALEIFAQFAKDDFFIQRAVHIPSIEWRSRANGTDCEETSNKE